MIIQTGMRTDIPAFYSEWLLNRIREGFVLVRNPYNPHQVTRYSLSPDVVDLMAFCTKNPEPLRSHMDELKRYGQYWFVTITPYGREIEPNVPDKAEVIESFKRLSNSVGVDSVGWRYDPIFIDDAHSVEWHIEKFDAIAGELAGFTKMCVISFIDIYKKVQRNFPSAREVMKKERLALGKKIIEIATGYGMTVRPCAEGDDLAPFGADCSGCMTVSTFETALHSRLNVPKRSTNQRNGQCACLLGVDIGAYDTCGHLCKYCYANSHQELVKANMKKHNPKSPFLLGNMQEGDVVHEAKQKSWLDGQMSLLDGADGGFMNSDKN
jgi:DNA repair photolyase